MRMGLQEKMETRKQLAGFKLSYSQLTLYSYVEVEQTHTMTN